MGRELAITQESFEALLAWLAPNRDDAGKKYETIRKGLVRIFISKRFNDAEDLADQVINRVIDRLPDIRDDYVGEPANYFRGVARNVIHEARRRKEIVIDPPPVQVSRVINTSDEYDCLLKCLKLLPADKRELALDFYVYDKRDKIAHHKQLALELGITESNLRVRVHRIRETLEKCVIQCVKTLR
jgi:RNA polymerase sigma factor (sigma-70 family)